MAIVNIGSMNIDKVYGVEQFVTAGETISATSYYENFGGKGLNQSVAIARAGAKVFHAGAVGTDGQCLLDFLQDSGVDISLIRRADVKQGNALIQVDANGQNCIIVYGGSNAEVTKEDVDAVLSHFRPGDYLVLQNETSSLAYAVDAAYARGLCTVLNASPVNEKLKDVDLGKLGWLMVNEIECCLLAGEEEPRRAFEVLTQKYPNLGVLMTLGAEGAWCAKNGETFRQPAFRAKAVDTTAAGDTFTGFFIGSLENGKPLPQALKTAAMAASIAITRPGAAPSIPGIAEVEEALARA